MTCRNIQKMIMPFIDNELTIDEADEFLEHLKNCPECMEELEFYYTLITSMKQLDDDQELSNDYRKDLIELLDKSEEKIHKKRKRQITKRLSLALIIGAIALTSTYRIGEYVVDDVKNRAEVSNFMPEEVHLISPNHLPPEIERQFPDIFLYLRQTDRQGAASMSEYYGSAIWKDMIIQKEFGQSAQMPEWTVLRY